MIGKVIRYAVIKRLVSRFIIIIAFEAICSPVSLPSLLQSILCLLISIGFYKLVELHVGYWETGNVKLAQINWVRFFPFSHFKFTCRHMAEDHLLDL